MQDPNQVQIAQLTDRDKGRWVEYRGYAGEREKGRIKSWNHEFVFVVYKCGENWDDYLNYTAAATKPEQLFFTDQLVG